MDTQLKNRVVLVTGAAGGIGSELVRFFAREGAKVVLHFHLGKERAESLVKTVDVKSCFPIQADLTKEADVTRMWSSAEQKLGPIEIVVANAGIYVEEHMPVQQMSLKQWQNTLDTNLTSIFLCMREFFRSIEKNSIKDPAAVLIGSTAGIFGEAGHSDYAASKAAATYGFMLSLKNEMVKIAPKGRINAICPSWTLSPMAEDFMSEPASVLRTLQTVPLRKVARPADVAASAVFLASSSLSGHMSGQTIQLAGGMEGRIIHSQDEIDLSKA